MDDIGSKYELLNEKLLLDQIALGNEKAFKILFDNYKARLYRLALKMTKSTVFAEDIVQEVFLSIWQTKETLPSIENPSAYIFTIAYNKVFKTLRKIAHNDEFITELIIRNCPGQETTRDMVDVNESQKLINLAIKQLPPQRQLVYNLSRKQGLSHDEIANQLKISRSTVKNQLVHALRHIRTKLNKGFMFTLMKIFFH